MNTSPQEPGQITESAIKQAIRRMLGFKAMRTLRGMVNEIEREETADRRVLRTLLIALPAILILAAAFFIWFRSTLSIQQF
jgi:cell division septal protein FtsQ